MITQLLQGCEQLALELSDKQIKQVEDYTTELKKWNKVINLTSIDADKDIVVMHFLDCFAIHPYIKGETLVDVGSGGGFPGMALSILLPDLNVYCVDTVGKKISFLTRVKSVIGSKNVYPTHQRIEAFNAIKPDQVVARAFSSIQKFFSLSELESFKESQFLAMKSKLVDQEIEESAYKNNVTIERLTIPFLNAQRFLVIK